jgi:1-deoxy-D-xylulose-5-phosphate reductoisomerase
VLGGEHETRHHPGRDGVHCVRTSARGEFPEEFSVAGLAARGSNVECIADVCRKYAPKAVALLDDRAVDRLAKLLSPPRPELLRGPAGLAALAGEVDADIVVSALVGAAGLLPTMAALRGRTLPWPTRETLVMAGGS